MELTYRFVAMLDILGFQHLVEHTDTQELAQLLADVCERGLLPVSEFSKYDADGKMIAYELLPPKLYVFSDTMFMCTPPISIEKSNSENSLAYIRHFFMCVANLLFYGFRYGLPMRGGVASGLCCIDEESHVMAGAPIVNAYKVEQAQQWIGCALHPSCIGGDSPAENAVMLGPHVLDYRAPLKPDTPPQPDFDLNHVVDWIAPQCLISLPDPKFRGIDYSETIERVGRRLYECLHRCSDESVRSKYEKTIDFYRHYRSLHG